MKFAALLIVAVASPPFRTTPPRDDLVRIADPRSVISGKMLVADDYQRDFVVLLFHETFRPDGSWRFSHAGVALTVHNGTWVQNKRGEICVTYDVSKCRAFFKSPKNPGYVFVEPLAGGRRHTRVRMRITVPSHPRL